VLFYILAIDPNTKPFGECQWLPLRSLGALCEPIVVIPAKLDIQVFYLIKANAWVGVILPW